MTNIVKPKLDIIFKKLFTENKDLLQDFLSSVLEIPYSSIKDIVIQNTELLPEDIEGKFSRMDLKMKVDAQLVNVEVQIRKVPDFKDRILFYWSKLYSGDLKKGDDYSDLKRSISINIVDFELFDCESYHSTFSIMENTRHELLTDKCAIHFFELKKIAKHANKDDKMELWLQLINAESEEEFNMLEQTGVEPIKKAVYTLHQMSEDEKIREIAYIREKALHDEASVMKGAINKGIVIGEARGFARGETKGRAEGKAESIQEIIQKMRELGLSEEIIKRTTEQ